MRSYGDRVVTLTGTANYLVAGKETAYLLAKAKVVRKGGHTAVVSADVFDDKGTLLANGSFTFYVLPRLRRQFRQDATAFIRRI